MACLPPVKDPWCIGGETIYVASGPSARQRCGVTRAPGSTESRKDQSSKRTISLTDWTYDGTAILLTIVKIAFLSDERKRVRTPKPRKYFLRLLNNNSLN
jgi:hypothetical protein